MAEDEPKPDAGADDGGKPRPIDYPGAEWPEKKPVRSRLRSSPFTRQPAAGGGGGGSKGSRLPWRLLIYAIVLLYLLADLQLFNGPLKRYFEERRGLSATTVDVARRKGWVAIVNGEPVSVARLDRAVDAYLYQRGRTRDQLSPGSLRDIRGAVLHQVIDDLIVEQHAAGQGHAIDDAAVDRAVERFEAQFKDAESLARRSAAQFLDSAGRRERLAQLETQADWLESQLAASPQVTEESAREWFEANRAAGIEGGFGVPEVMRARHIFLSTLGIEGDGPEQRIRELRRQLVEDGADFAQLAAEHSQDPRSKAYGGDLNWFSRARMPSDFFEPITDLPVGQLSEPIRTSIGWHLVEVTDRKPAREATFEDMRDEIIAYLTTEDRRQKIEEFVLNLRRASIIRIFPEQLGAEPATR